mmetsp:Transcript_9270/g.14967  ORF Transcript_9270/g.14967 Transcript_9270/m.14967 type:complete len:401 (+) Transcript_9270:560-1762(+)
MRIKTDIVYVLTKANYMTVKVVFKLPDWHSRFHIAAASVIVGLIIVSGILIMVTDQIRFTFLRHIALMLASWIFTYLGIHSCSCLRKEMRMTFGRIINIKHRTKNSTTHNVITTSTPAPGGSSRAIVDAKEVSVGHISLGGREGAVTPLQHQRPYQLRVVTREAAVAAAASSGERKSSSAARPHTANTTVARKILNTIEQLGWVIFAFTIFCVCTTAVLLVFIVRLLTTDQGSYREEVNDLAENYNFATDLSSYLGIVVLLGFQYYARDPDGVPCCGIIWDSQTTMGPKNREQKISVGVVRTKEGHVSTRSDFKGESFNTPIQHEEQRKKSFCGGGEDQQQARVSSNTFSRHGQKPTDNSSRTPRQDPPTSSLQSVVENKPSSMSGSAAKAEEDAESLRV